MPGNPAIAVLDTEGPAEEGKHSGAAAIRAHGENRAHGEDCARGEDGEDERC